MAAPLRTTKNAAQPSGSVAKRQAEPGRPGCAVRTGGPGSREGASLSLGTSYIGGLASDVILKRFENPDETRRFEKGKFELVQIGDMTIGRATYDPGWKWSEHVGKATGATRCYVEHVGVVLAGCAAAAMDDGRVFELHAGDVFYIPPGHDSWVVGDEAYVSLHFMGAADYAREHKK